jgi:CIC family chloride channel protein
VDYLRRLLRTIVPPRAETSAVGTMVVLAGLVGIGGGLLVLLTDWAIRLVHLRVMAPVGEWGRSLPGVWRFLPAVSPPVFLAAVLLLVSWMLRRWAPEARGTGTDQVMSAVGRRGGFIRKRVIGFKVLATSLCIGAGAPLGLEGPVVHTGGALGSLLGRRFKMGMPNIRILVAAGAAAGLAAKYGAPIAGAVFSAELILGSASAGALLPLILSSFLAVATRDAVLRGAPEYVIPSQPGFALVDYVLFVALGVACGIVACYFVKIVFASERAMQWLVPSWWGRALLGGLGVGALCVVWPELLRTGKPMIQALLHGPQLAVTLLLLIIVLKPLLCSVALGSGASGGVFGPALLTGAAVGALFAQLLGGLLPVDIAPTTSYIMAGMAGVIAGVMRAPLQAIIITFELTHDYSVIPCLMITCVISTKVSELFEPESVFTRKLVRAGERLRAGLDFSLLDGLAVRDVMAEDYVALPADASIRDIHDHVRRSENRTFPVVGEDGRLMGIVMLASLVAAAARAEGRPEAPRVRDLLEPDSVHLAPDDSLYDAWQTMGNYDYDCLPVCRAGPDGPSVVGICEKEAILEMHDRQAFVSMDQSPAR